MLLLSRQRGGKRDPHVLHRQPSRSAPHRSHRVLRRPTLPLHLGDGKTVYGVSREVKTAGVVEGFLSRSVLLGSVSLVGFAVGERCSRFLSADGRVVGFCRCLFFYYCLRLALCHHQLPSDATRPLEEEEFSPQVRDVSNVIFSSVISSSFRKTD